MPTKAKIRKPKFLRKPDDRPGQILDAAEKVFGKFGYDAASLEQIAKEAGISKGTIYLYFKNKKTVFIEMMKRRLSDVIESLKSEYSDDGADSFEDIYRVLITNFRGLLTHPAYPSFLKLMIAESGRFPGIAEDFFKGVIFQAIGIGSGIYESEARKGNVKKLKGRVAMRCLIGMHLVFVITQEIMRAKEYDPLEWDEVFKTIDTIFWEGIRRTD